MSGRHAAPEPQEGAQGRAPRPKREVESDEFAAALERWMWAMGRRCGVDPGALVYVERLDQVWRDAKNLAFFSANKVHGYSLAEIGRYTETSRPAVSQRVASGEKVHNQLTVAQGGGALVRIGDLRRQRAERHLDTGTEDTTGGRRELAVYEELRSARLRAVGE